MNYQNLSRSCFEVSLEATWSVETRSVMKKIELATEIIFSKSVQVFDWGTIHSGF